MSNQYYNHDDGAPVQQTRGLSTVMRGEFDKTSQGFDKLPPPDQVWTGNQNFVTAGGAADFWTATLATAHVTALADGMQLRVKFNQANATQAPTLNLNTLGNKPIVSRDGSAIGVGDIFAGMTVTLTYDAASGAWRMYADVPLPAVTDVSTTSLSNKELVNPADRTKSLPDGDAIDWDMAGGQLAFLRLSTQRLTRVLNNPSHLKPSVHYTLIVTQHPNGGQNITGFGSAYLLLEDVTINAAANSVTVLHMFSDGVKLYVAKHGGATGGSPAPAPSPGPSPSPPPAGGPLTAAFAAGVNLSGMEWAAPGVRYGTSTYPNINYTVPRASDVAYLASQGVTLLRLPLQWELLQPLRASSPANSTVVAAYNSSLGAYSKGALWEPYAQAVDKILDAALAAGIKVIIDIHNYCRYREFKYQADGSVLGFVDPANDIYPAYTSDNTQVVSTIFAKTSPTLTQADFTDLWTKIATRWKTHAGLGGYGLMNEPHDMPAVGKNFGVNEYPPGYPSPDFNQDYTIWPTYAQAAVTAIRALDGNTPIYVGGNDYQNPMFWGSINPGFPLSGARIIYEFHLYLDATSGGFRFDWDDELAKHFSAGEGGVDISVNTGTNRIAPILTWAAANGNPVLACTEFGIPIENTSGGVLDTRWLSAAAATLTTLKNNNIQTFTWMGGNHWPIHSYPINHVPKWYQGTTVEPIAGAYLKNKLGTNQAVIFDEGGQWSAGGAAVSVKVQARGNLTSSVTLTLASDNGGSFSKTTLTLAAGVNSEDSYTFTPASNLVTTISYTRSGGGQKPPNRVVYSLTDPVGYASTSLANAAKAILAKYGAACWLARDAFKDYLTPAAAACAPGDSVRAIADSGSGSTIDNPMEAINWLNQDTGGLRGGEVPVAYNNDPNGFAAIDFTTYGRRGLLSRHLAPVVDTSSDHSQPNYRYPAAKMPFNLKDNHFMIAAFSIATAGVDGTLLSAQEIFTAAHSAIMLTGNKVHFEVVDENNVSQSVTDATARSTGSLVVATGTSTSTTQRLRVNSGSWGSASAGTSPFAASTYSTAGIAMGYWNYFPQQTTQGYGYGFIMGAGAPTDAELGVLESYLSSFAQATGPTDPGEIAIQAAFTAGNLGWWGDNRALTEFDVDGSVPGVHPSTWTDLIGRWTNHGNRTNLHDLLQTDATLRFQLGTDAGGKHYAQGFNGAPMKNVGASTTAFYVCIALNMTATYDGVIISDRLTANTGFTLEQEAFAAVFYAKFGTGSALATCTSPVYGASNSSAPTCVLEAWYDGANCAIRMNKGTPDSHALASLAAGTADMLLCGNYPLSGGVSSNNSTCNIYEAVVFKNYCPNSSDRNAIASWVGAQAGLTI